MVAVAIILGAVTVVIVLDIGEQLEGSSEIRVFSEATVVLGVEHRSWTGWNNGYSGSGDPPRGDIDHVYLNYQNGPIFNANEIGSVLINWRGTDGNGGRLRFVNPNRFDDNSDQQFHDGDIGGFCTGNLRAGERLTIRMVHNRWQGGGQTDPEDVGVRYVESNSNDISRGGNEPFFRVSNRYPILFNGQRPMEPGDDVQIRFYGPEDETIVSQITTTASVYNGEPSELSVPSC
jgi:hypothetical protein